MQTIKKRLKYSGRDNLPPSEFLSVASVARMLDLSTVSVYQLINDGIIPALSIKFTRENGKPRWKVRPTDLSDYVAANTGRTKPSPQ